MEKINLSSFTANKLTARLFVLLRNMPDISSFANTEDFKSYCAALVRANFIYPAENEHNIVTDLCLFLLGEDCKFSKITNL